MDNQNMPRVTEQADERAKLPLIEHPEPRVMAWTALEENAIRAAQYDAFDAGYRAALTRQVAPEAPAQEPYGYLHEASGTFICASAAKGPYGGMHHVSKMKPLFDRPAPATQQAGAACQIQGGICACAAPEACGHPIPAATTASTDDVQDSFEAWAMLHGGLPLDRAGDNLNTDDGLLHFPTYKFGRTEIAWRAWANRRAPAPSRDAARYRGWRDHMLAEDPKFVDAMQDSLPDEVGASRTPTAAEWDAAIDAAIAASAAEQKGPQ